MINATVPTSGQLPVMKHAVCRRKLMYVHNFVIKLGVSFTVS